jgi:hypothetical protein
VRSSQATNRLLDSSAQKVAHYIRDLVVVCLEREMPDLVEMHLDIGKLPRLYASAPASK